MQAVRTIIWVMLAVLVVVFAMFNWVPATVRFWPGMVLETKLPVIAIGAFLLGSLPLWLTHRITKWRLSRQLDTSQRELEIYRGKDVSHVSAAAAAKSVDQRPTNLEAPAPAPAPSPTTADQDIADRS